MEFFSFLPSDCSLVHVICKTIIQLLSRDISETSRNYKILLLGKHFKKYVRLCYYDLTLPGVKLTNVLSYCEDMNVKIVYNNRFLYRTLLSRKLIHEILGRGLRQINVFANNEIF